MLFAKQKIKLKGKNFLIKKIILTIRVRQGMGVGGVQPPSGKNFWEKIFKGESKVIIFSPTP
jgi:hypothetical protein